MAHASLAHRALAAAVGAPWAREGLDLVPAAVRGRLVAGETAADALDVAGQLVSTGRLVTIRHLATLPRTPAEARANGAELLEVLEAIGEVELAADGAIDVAVDLPSLGLGLLDGPQLAAQQAHEIAAAADRLGTRATIETAPPPRTPGTPERLLDADGLVDLVRPIHEAVRAEVPGTGISLRATLPRTAGDCMDLAAEPGRVRISRGAVTALAADPAVTASTVAADLSLARCVAVLMAGPCHPMVLSHDARIVDIVGALASRSNRRAPDFEYQMMLGLRPDEQIAIADRGDQMRVHVPYGPQWEDHLLARLVEYPSDVLAFLRGLRVPRSVR